jgi:hypothetical protein
MDISSLSSFNTTITSLSSTGAVQGAGSGPFDADGDGDAGGHRVHGGRHGRMGEAVMQALQSLGISMPAPDGQAGNASSSQDNGSSGATAGGADAASGSGDVRKDVHNFMHALFEAVKSESSGDAGAADGTNSTANGPSSFASGLSALVTQASNGTAPADLQSAFDVLQSDVQAAGSSSSADGSSGTQVSLQAFLTKLQDGLGYGTTANSSSSTGNILNSVA